MTALVCENGRGSDISVNASVRETSVVDTVYSKRADSSQTKGGSPNEARFAKNVEVAGIEC